MPYDWTVSIVLKEFPHEIVIRCRKYLCKKMDHSQSYCEYIQIFFFRNYCELHSKSWLIAGLKTLRLYLGIIQKQYGPTFRRYHQLTVSILKEFGFGHGMIDQRIQMEAEELVGLIKAKKGCTFHPGNLFNMCTMNIIASIMFGQRRSQTDERLYRYRLLL